MNYVSLLIKPASSLCNMRCSYCFYADESAHRQQANMGLMTHDTFCRTLRAAFDATDDGGAVNISFQGGEPTLAGLDFFRQGMEAARRLNTRGLKLSWGIQTNGLALDAEWVDFFRKNDFLVGVSLDGDAAAHDKLRRDAAGQPTYTRVCNNVQLLLDADVDVNLLCVVNADTAQNAKRIYRSLKATGARYLQFIPCLDPLESPRGRERWSLTPEAYGRFLCAAFDEWYNDWRTGRYISVRLFDDIVHMSLSMAPGTCASGGLCGQYLVVEADGGLYPCDFYALDEWRLGSVDDGIAAAFDSEIMRRFRMRGAQKPAQCNKCRWFMMCRGGCPRDWVGVGDGSRNYLCRALRRLFEYAAGRINEIASAERRAMGIRNV